MNNIEKYYSNTKNAKPNYTVKRFIELKSNQAMQLKLDVEQEEILYI